MRTGRLLAAVVATTIVTGSSWADAPTPSAAPQTATGRVSELSPVPALAVETLPDGTRTYCDIWRGGLRTNAGQTIGFYVESPMSGTFPNLHPTDQGAVQTVYTLHDATVLGKAASITITYTGPAMDCGYSLDRVVTSAVLNPLPLKTRTVSGSVAYISGRVTYRGDGAVCAEWHGSLALSRNRLFLFNVESEATGGRVDPHALRLVNTLRRTERQGPKAVAALTYHGPVLACGRLFPRLVMAVSARRRGAT